MSDAWTVSVLVADVGEVPVVDVSASFDGKVKLTGDVRGLVDIAGALGEIRYSAERDLFVFRVAVQQPGLPRVMFCWLFDNFRYPEGGRAKPLSWALNVDDMARMSTACYVQYLMAAATCVQVEDFPESKEWSCADMIQWQLDAFNEMVAATLVASHTVVPDLNDEMGEFDKHVFVFQDKSIVELGIIGWEEVLDKVVVPASVAKLAGGGRAFRTVSVSHSDQGSDYYN